MLARTLTLRNSYGVEVGTTPMLIPSFSSIVDLDIREVFNNVGPYITGPILISAYDMHYVEQYPPVDFSSLVFIDSGGYECARWNDIFKRGFYRYEANEWSRDLHLKTINALDVSPPKVVISYDHHSESLTIEEQIKNARELFRNNDDFMKEILIKPEPKNSAKIDFNQVIQNLDQLAQFDILGFTEKELGFSVLDRMVSIAKIRQEMDRRKINVPIHIFGSLDTITTPLYYLSGADIFDGLAWLRFILSKYGTLYLDSFGPRECGIEVPMSSLLIKYITQNIIYLNRLTIDFEKFNSTGDFEHLGDNASFFEKSYADLKVKIGGDI